MPRSGVIADSEVDRQMRAALHLFYDSNSSLAQTRPLLGESPSIQLLASQEAAAGWRRDGRLSSVRRFFCLYCTFDLFFTALIWLTCIMLTGASIQEMWKTEILKYTFHSSLVDIVGVAIVRFLILLIIYAAVHVDHWCPVAFTTSGSCAFLITKVFLFDWTKTPQPVFEVSFILISFALCWSEAWFLDCKVLPAEFQAMSMIAAIEQQQPVIRGNQINVPSDLNSVTDYYSPRDSPNNSPQPGRRIPSCFTAQEETYRRQASEIIDAVLNLRSAVGWKECKKGVRDGDTVKSMQTQKFGRVFLMTGVVNCRAEKIFEELSDKVDEIPKWNPVVLESKFLHRIDNEIGVTYQVSASFGPVSSRDFVNLRKSVRIGDLYICCGFSIDHPDFPHMHLTRAENKLSCWVMQPLMPKSTRDKPKCRFQWLMSCDLKVWGVPQKIIDTNIPKSMLDFLHHLRSHVEVLQV